MIDGLHNENYFAYTWYVRNEGQSEVGYAWDLKINQASLGLSEAVWVIVFEDGEMRLYAKANRDTGEAESLPPFGDNSRGYMSIPLMELAPGSDQFGVVANSGRFTYYRTIPDAFLSEELIASGMQDDVAPMEIHKYTVVLYLEGDDPDCTDELIDGTLGVEMNYRLILEEPEEQTFLQKWNAFWERIWSGMNFWETDEK